MIKNYRPKSPVLYPVNVQILQKKTNGTIINQQSAKNAILKEYGLYSWIRFIIGDFHNNSLIDEGQYIPKYLALGSNEGDLTGAPGTTTTTQITDISLYHELFDKPAGYNRIRINRANYIEDNEQDPYLKIQYEAYVPEDRYVNETIGELALMTMSSGYNAFARLTGFEPFVKEPNSIIQIIWEITIISVESNTRFVPPVKTYLREAIEKAINVLQVDTTDPEGLKGARVELNKLIEPATNVGTGLYYLLNDNEQITQDVINNYLSKPFKSITDTGLIPLIQKFPSGKNWKPSGYVVS